MEREEKEGAKRRQRVGKGGERGVLVREGGDRQQGFGGYRPD